MRVVRAEDFGRVSADAFVELLAGAESAVVGLATGSTPIAMYEEMGRRVAAERLDLRAVRPFAIDEYVAARAHRCSNHSFFARYWNAIPGVAAVQELDPEQRDLAVEAARLAEALATAGGLDGLVLGIGMNGHLAFNEPGSARDSTARVVELEPPTRESASACWGPDVPERGLTLGLGELLAARRVLLLANGAKKREIVRRTLTGAVGPECPASLLQEHPSVTVVLDRTAGEGIA